MIIDDREFIETTQWLKTGLTLSRGGICAAYFEAPDGPVPIYAGFSSVVTEMFGRANEVLYDIIHKVPRGDKSISDFLVLYPGRAVLIERSLGDAGPSPEITLGNGNPMLAAMYYERMHKLLTLIVARFSILQALAEASS